MRWSFCIKDSCPSSRVLHRTREKQPVHLARRKEYKLEYNLGLSLACSRGSAGTRCLSPHPQQLQAPRLKLPPRLSYFSEHPITSTPRHPVSAATARLSTILITLKVGPIPPPVHKLGTVGSSMDMTGKYSGGVCEHGRELDGRSWSAPVGVDEGSMQRSTTNSVHVWRFIRMH